MKGERVVDRLEHILEAIRGIEDTTAGLSRETVMEHWTLRSAVERGVEVISEAARHLPPELTDAHPDVPWKNIRAIGNFLRHEYDRLESEIIWQIASEAVIPLKAAVQAMLAELRASTRKTD
jgi:uncharacterized protein with HEPN domain